METKKLEINRKEYLVEIEAFDVKDEDNEPMEYRYKGTNAIVKQGSLNVLIRKYDDENSANVHLRKEEVDAELAADLKEIIKNIFNVEVINYLTDEGYKPQ